MEQNKDMTPLKKEDELLDGAKATEKIAVFDYLRTFAILLVLLHHAILAYVTFVQLNPVTPPSPLPQSLTARSGLASI